MQKNSKNLKILFLDILTDSPKERKRFNKIVYGGKTYSEVMMLAFGLQKNEWETAYASHDKLPRTYIGLDAIVIGGSMHDSINGNETPWMRLTFKFIKNAKKNGIPIFGICGGLQFTVRALGGNVIINPKGCEFGSISVGLKPAGKKDLLFKGLPPGILAQSSHRCMAKNLKPGWKLLASSKICAPQAIAIGKHIRLLQFHPEMSTSMLKGLARYKHEPTPVVFDASKYGKKIIHNFLQYFVLPYHEARV